VGPEPIHRNIFAASTARNIVQQLVPIPFFVWPLLLAGVLFWFLCISEVCVHAFCVPGCPKAVTKYHQILWVICSNLGCTLQRFHVTGSVSPYKILFTSNIYCGSQLSFYCPPPPLQSLPYRITIARPLRNIRLPFHLPFVCYTPYSIGNNNIVWRPKQPRLEEHTHTRWWEEQASSLVLSGAPVCGVRRLPERSRRDTDGVSVKLHALSARVNWLRVSQIRQYRF